MVGVGKGDRSDGFVVFGGGDWLGGWDGGELLKGLEANPLFCLDLLGETGGGGAGIGRCKRVACLEFKTRNVGCHDSLRPSSFHGFRSATGHV